MSTILAGQRFLVCSNLFSPVMDRLLCQKRSYTSSAVVANPDAKSAKCNCTKFGLPCTEFCKCRGEGKCENIVSRVLQEELSGSEESEDNEQKEDAYEQ